VSALVAVVALLWGELTNTLVTCVNGARVLVITRFWCKIAELPLPVEFTRNVHAGVVIFRAVALAEGIFRALSRQKLEPQKYHAQLRTDPAQN
jgi:hypothetical protein